MMKTKGYNRVIARSGQRNLNNPLKSPFLKGVSFLSPFSKGGLRGITVAILFLLLLSTSAFSYEIEIKGSIPIEDKITGISVNPVTGKAAAISEAGANGRSPVLYIIDVPSATISEKISLTAAPTGIAIDSKRNMAIVSSTPQSSPSASGETPQSSPSASGESPLFPPLVRGELKGGIVYFIDLEKKSIISTTSVEKGIYSIAVAQDNDKALLGTQDGIIIIDLESKNIIREIPLQFRVQRIIENNGNAIVSGSYSLTEAVLQVIDLSKGVLLKEASFSSPLPSGERDWVRGISLDIDKNFGIILISQQGSDTLLFYDLNLQPITNIALSPLGNQNTPLPSGERAGVRGISINPSTHIAVLTDSHNNSISIIDIEKRILIGTTAFTNIGTMPDIVSIDPSSNTAFISYEQGIVLIKLENPVPKIDRLIPSAARSGDGGLAISIEGSKFIKDTQPQFNKRDVEGNFSSNEKLQAKISQEDLSSPGDVPVTVTNPSPGGGASNALIFKIYNPAPVLESISPDTISLGSTGFGSTGFQPVETGKMPVPPERPTTTPITLKVSGRNFFNGSTVTLNGINLRTRFISSILLEAEINPSDIKTTGRYTVTVINPSPAFASSPLYLNVVEEMPVNQMTKKAADGPPGVLKGRILDTNKKPVEGVTVKIKNIAVQTDSNGSFTINNVPSGKQHLMIHGETARDAESRYPTIPLTINIEPGKINEMPFQVYLHKQKNRDFKQIEHSKPLSIMGKEAPLINRDGDLIVTDKEHPGVELKIPKGVKITGWDGRPNMKVSVRTVPTDRLPVKPLPDNAKVRTVYMFYFNKPGGGTPDQPIPFKSPNDLGLLPGEKAILWYYDESPNEGEAPNDWAIAGTGTVTPDGRYIITDPGVGIPKFCCGATAWGGSGAGGEGSGGDGCGAAGGGFGSGGPSSTAGKPVDLATGYELYSKTDLHIPGIIPVSITRYYRTGDPGIGMFGRGTYFEYDWWLGAYGATGVIDNTNPTMFLLIKPGNYQYRFDTKQADGTFTSTISPAMRGAVITRNSDGTKTLRMRDGWTYKFDSSGDLIEIADRNGNKLTLNRRIDFEGSYLKEIIMPDGKKITFNQTYMTGTGGRLSFFRTDSIVDPQGRTITYTYEFPNSGNPLPLKPSRLKTVTYPDGSTIEYQYDSSDRMSGFINERGKQEILIEYDANNRVTKQTHSDGGTTTFNYTVAGGFVTETSMTAPNGAVTTWRFNNWKYITEMTTPDGTTVYERDPNTNLLLSVTDPLLRKMTYTYDANGRTTAITDNAGNVTRYEYEDTFSNVTKITDAIGNVTTMSYDTKGNLIQLRTPNSQLTTFSYNSIGKPASVTDAMGNISTMEYDASGNLTMTTDPLGNASQMAYDNLNRLIKITDAKGKETGYNYDRMGRIQTVTDPLNSITRYFYESDGKLSVVIDAKYQEIIYNYDSRGRLIKMTDQLGNAERYTYNTSDNLISVTDRKDQTTTYTYDQRNRLTKATYNDGSYTEYVYDTAGRLTTITDSISGAISYTYSNSGCSTGTCSGGAADKMVKEVTPLGTIDYAYDAIGRRTGMTVAGQPTVSYSYDANSRLTGINTTINNVGQGFSLAYDNIGRRTSLTLPNGVTTNYNYDNASRLLEMEHLAPLGSVLEALTYSYDATGNRISMNRPAVTLPLRNDVTNTNYNDANQMLKYNASSDNISYDENGNMTSLTNSCGTTNYTWDVRNRLVGINGYNTDCSALSASFKYDTLGRRIEKTINGRTIQYLYDGLDIVQEIENGAVSANYIRTMNIDEPLVRVKADGSVRYYQQDALGSVIAMTDDTGAVRTQYSYDSFGAVIVSGETSDNPFQYTGRENDETGLYYYRARYYSPELQRFVSEDPIGLEGGDVNFFRYVFNNPLSFTDPRGLYILIDPPPPRVPPRQPPPGSPLDALLRCMEDCIGRTLIITSTYEDTPEHPPGTPHRRGVAVDIRPPGGGNSGGLLCCASQCGAGFSQDEGNHIHVQIPPGRKRR